MTQWNPDLYLQFEKERTQPVHDLAARVELDNPSTIVDLGCGPGNSTRVLRTRWPHARILGLDNSPEMLTKARSDCPEGEWIQADLVSWRSAVRHGLVFSNATIQWIPDHVQLIRVLFDAVESGGALAVQVPANSESPLHQALLKVSRRAPWREKTARCEALMTYHPPGFYYEHLSTMSRRIILWQTTYFHAMSSHQGLIDWYSGTGMKPFLQRLADEDQRLRFKDEVLEDCRPSYPVQPDGRILFPFQRTFFIAYRG